MERGEPWIPGSRPDAMLAATVAMAAVGVAATGAVFVVLGVVCKLCYHAFQFGWGLV